MGTLRQEILQSQEARSDLLKWKLGLVGAIGTIGLGLAGSRASAHADLVLCAVPLVCVYVDLLCRHLSLRILVIGTFFRALPLPETGTGTDAQAEATVLQAYEVHSQRMRALKYGGAFALEDWAVTWSTVVLSVAVLVYGIFVRVGTSPDRVPVGWAFILSGALGFTSSIGSQILYRIKRKGLTEQCS